MHCVKANLPHWESLEDIPFINPIRCKMVRGAPAHSKSFVVAPFLVPDHRVRDAAAQLDELNTMGLTGHRGQVVALNLQRPHDCTSCNG